MININSESEIIKEKEVLRDQNLIEDVNLKCPKCKEIFTISDFESSELSKAHFQHFVQKLTEYTKKQIETEIETKLNQKYQLEFDNKINTMKLNNTEQLNKKLGDFAVEKEQLVKKFTEDLNRVNLVNQDLKSKLDNLEVVKSKEIAEQLNKKLEDFAVEKEQLVKKFTEDLNKQNEEIHKLELENQKNKLRNNKILGENLEQEIEEVLTKTFLLDSVSKITTTGKKADLTQKVKLDGTNNYIATITYEIKNTKDWNDQWEVKFADDMRKTSARYGIITATAFPIKYGNKLFAISEFNPNIYFCSHENVDLVAQIVRMFILTEYRIENATKNNNELENKILKLSEWKKIDFPNFSGKIKNAIEALERVKNAISNQMTPLEKNINIIKNNFIDEIEKNLNSLIV